MTDQIARHYQNVGPGVSEEDVQKLLELHNRWWYANHLIDIPLMQTCFVEGTPYHMFNLQGHPYYGLAEKTKLWEFYKTQLRLAVDPPRQIVQFLAQGDLAWLSAEIVFPVQEVGDKGLDTRGTNYDPKDSLRIRSTECYRRDDGNGNPEWRMWHFHCSPAPDADDPRPAYGDTARERGELIP